MATVIEDKNFSNLAVEDIPKHGIYRGCNFARQQPATTGAGTATGVRLFPGDDTPRVFENCNLFNCEPPPGSRISNCNTWIVQTGVTPATKEDEVLEVDGVEVSRVTFHDRINYGKWTEAGYEYIVPIRSPEDYV